MRWRIMVALFAVVIASAGCSGKQGRAGKNLGGARHHARDQYLDALAGQWRIVRTDGQETTHHTADAQWVLGDWFLHLHLRDMRQPPEYEASVLLGFDASHSRYVAVWCDTFGAEYARIGYGTREGNDVRFRFEYDAGVFFNTFSWNPDIGTWRFTGENELEDGSLQFFMEDRLSRR